MSDSKPTACFICGAPCTPEMRSSSQMVWSVSCPRCGPYRLPWTDAGGLDLNADQRGALSGFLRHRAERGEPEVTLTANRAERAPGHVTIEDAMAARPERAGEVQDAILLSVARAIRSPGGTKRLNDDEEAPLAYSLDPAAFAWHVRQLLARGLLQHAKENGFYDLSHKGWALVDELERGADVDPDQAFVAMWFDLSMDEVYRTGIEPAVKAAGYRPYRIKDVEHNNKICDEILAEIRKSRFVVAEFTGNRGGVYFEAGFALGLGRPVIWVVQEPDLASVHFDTNHFNHIAWSTVDELRTKLQRRIEATIPRQARGGGAHGRA